ncbi:hypothetical protein [Thalassospira sp. TSL5-1]|uniref:hypothetical protein n=1 Tax=Thalassospira sp. TSL5-1 TaxID=1544451 RepID=UPI00093A8AB5|nr:hypothetical protein [Thalassospira sp. TSL5-1]OKH88352.1 hypothetical protein LF95_17180 [Thalassospira sp. TSL5-1]
MTPEHYIDRLLQKYQKYPGFPFDDWVQNAGSFYALINIWDEIFKASAGKLFADYVAYGDAQQDEYSFIYRVKHVKKNAVVWITPSWPALKTKIGGDGGILETVYPPEMQPRDDKYELNINSDLDRDRLVCFFEMIRHFIHNLPENSVDVERHNKMYIERYGKYFGW